MLTVLALSMTIAAVAPQNEEVGVPPQILGTVVGAALGAAALGASVGAGAFYTTLGACAQSASRDCPAIQVGVQLGLIAALMGGAGGGAIGWALTSGAEQGGVEDFPDE